MKYENTGSLIRKARISTGLTQKQLSKALKIHQQFLSNAERKKYNLPPKVIKNLIRSKLITRDEYLYAAYLDYRNHLEDIY